MTTPRDTNETLPSLDTDDAPLVAGAASRVPCLTILYHPSLERVGERMPILSRAGRSVALSRTEGDFRAPEGSAPRPLDDPYLSRDPLTVERVDGGGLRIVLDAKHGALLDGQPATTGGVVLSPERLAEGATLELSKRVVLLAHLIEVEDRPSTHGMVGESGSMRAVLRAAQNVADLATGVLLTGETGSGKDRVARLIHDMSARSGRFVAVNMANVNHSTAASELFGHVKGAFTGADRRHEGLFERAEGGTLFLDEIGELDQDVQGMLLRVLETGALRPLGATDERAIDVRVVAATDADLQSMVDEGTFRAALYHRFSSYRIHVPPLRERREDVPRLVVAFLREELSALGQATRLEAPPAGKHPWLHRRIMLRFYHHDWPGNVRQLRNVVRQLAISSRASDVAVVDEHVEAVLGRSAPSASTPPQGSGSGEVSLPSEAEVRAVLARHRWMFGPAARELGLNRTTFYRVVEQFPSIRKGSEIDEAELREAIDETDGDLDRMSERLQVSRRAIGLRMAELDLHPRVEPS